MNIEQSGLRSLWQEAFGDTEAFLDCFFQTAYSPSRCRCLTREGRIAAMLYWFDCEWNGKKLAYLYAVATAKAFRGQGLCHGLMDQTHRHLAGLGYCGTLLVPENPALFGLYESMGYHLCCSVREFTCTPGSETVPLRQIGISEYAQRRRALLPSGGVIQEGENLAFLAAQATLYAGSDCLLAASREGADLHGFELLGNPSAAPGILRALGCRTGTFRTPGPGAPFAMYRPLTPGPAPTYFGFDFG